MNPSVSPRESLPRRANRREKETVPESPVEERRREKEVIKGRLLRLTASCPKIADHVRRAVEQFNGTPGTPGDLRST